MLWLFGQSLKKKKGISMIKKKKTRAEIKNQYDNLSFIYNFIFV